MVVVNYLSHRLLADNLDPGLAESGIRVVIVDNSVDSGEHRALQELAGQRGWSVVSPATNLGFGEGVNEGVLHAARQGYGLFLTLNPDAVATRDDLSRLADAVGRNRDALISPVVMRPDGRPFFAGSTIDLTSGQLRSGWSEPDDDPVWKNWLSGACLGFSGDLFAALDGFSEGYFLYWEDVDLSRRAAEAGYRLILLDEVAIVHDEGGTHTAKRSQAKSALYYYYNTRNRLVFGARLADSRWRRRWLALTPRESLRIWLRGGRRQLLTFPQGAWAAVRGTLSGIRHFLRRARREV